MNDGTLGDRILDIRKRRGGRARPEGHDKLAAAMNALLGPEDQASGASVRRWENNVGKPSVVQGWALAQLDPEKRGTDWLAVDEHTPAAHGSAGVGLAGPNVPFVETGPLTEANRPGVKRPATKRRGTG